MAQTIHEGDIYSLGGCVITNTDNHNTESKYKNVGKYQTLNSFRQGYQVQEAPKSL